MNVWCLVSLLTDHGMRYMELLEKLYDHGPRLTSVVTGGAFVAQWRKPRTLNREVPGSNLLYRSCNNALAARHSILIV